MTAHPPASIFRAAGATFTPQTGTAFEMHENGLVEATGGQWTARIFRATTEGDVARALHWHDATFQYVHVLSGEIEYLLDCGRRERLQAGDAIYQPTGCIHCVTHVSKDLVLLEIFSPVDVHTTRVAE